MTHDLNHQIQDMIRTIALLEEKKRLSRSGGYDLPIRQACRRLEELRKRAEPT